MITLSGRDNLALKVRCVFLCVFLSKLYTKTTTIYGYIHFNSEVVKMAVNSKCSLPTVGLEPNLYRFGQLEGEYFENFWMNCPFKTG